MFISHSTQDMFLIRRLAKHLDNYGIDVVIAEEIRSPGIKLEEKFYSLIRECHFVLGILTSNGVNSEWVRKEIDYAYKINKPIIPLLEEGIRINMNIEYVPFDLSGSIKSIFDKIRDGIDKLREKRIIGHDAMKIIVPVVIAGLIGVFAGILITGSGKKS